MVTGFQLRINVQSNQSKLQQVISQEDGTNRIHLEVLKGDSDNRQKEWEGLT